MSNFKYALRTIVLSLAGSVLVFLGVGMVLADQWQVTTKRTIPASVEQVAPLLVDLSAWANWSAIEFQLGNPTTREVEGEAGKHGQRAIWRGPMGVATLTLAKISDAAIEYEIGYEYAQNGGSFGGKFTGTISWRPAGESIEVTWVEDGKLDNLMQRWSNWFGALQEKVQQVQRASLAGLEEHVRRADK